VPPLSGLLLEWCYTGRPPRKTRSRFSSLLSGPRKSQARAGSPELLMQAHGSQQVSLLTPRPIPGPAGSVRAFAGVAQLVEHLFCKQVVSGSIPLASSSEVSATTPQTLRILNTSEGCPSGQREQAVNLPARAYVGSNPTPSTSRNPARPARELGQGMPRPRRGFDDTLDSAGVAVPRRQNSPRAAFNSAGVTQLVESQFSKLKVDGSSPFSRSTFSSASSLLAVRTNASGKASKQTRPASLVAGEAEASTGAERTPVREHRSTAEAQPPAKIAGRRSSRVNVTSNAHLAQLVEHVLGKDEVISSNLMVGSNSVQP
jgi:hypothetical protein